MLCGNCFKNDALRRFKFQGTIFGLLKKKNVCYIAGILSTAISTATVIFAIIRITAGVSKLELKPTDRNELILIEGLPWLFPLIYCMVHIPVSVLLIYGVYKSIPQYMLPFMMTTLVDIFLTCGASFLLLIAASKPKDFFLGSPPQWMFTTGAILTFISVIFNIYFVSSVTLHFEELIAKPNGAEFFILR